MLQKCLIAGGKLVIMMAAGAAGVPKLPPLLRGSRSHDLFSLRHGRRLGGAAPALGVSKSDPCISRSGTRSCYTCSLHGQ